MEEFGNLLHGFSIALTLPNLLYMLVGIVLGVRRWPTLIIVCVGYAMLWKANRSKALLFLDWRRE